MGKRQRYLKRLFSAGYSEQIDLITMTAQELKSPLTLISGLSSILLTESTFKKRQHNDISRIMRTSDRLLAVVEGLVAAGKLKSGQWQLQREPIILLNLLTSLLKQLEPRFKERKLHVVIDRHYNLSPVLADYDCLYHVLYNLLDNALKYSPAKAKIVIRPQRQQNSVTIDIENTGKGVKTAPLEQFVNRKRAHTKDALNNGGLGLYIVQTLIEAQGGSIHISLEPQKIRFRLKLPMVRQLSLFSNKIEAREELVTV